MGLGVSCTPEAPCYGADIGVEKHTLHCLQFPLHVLDIHMGEFCNC